MQYPSYHTSSTYGYSRPRYAGYAPPQVASAAAFAAPTFGVQSAIGRPFGGYDANVNMSNRIQMLQMQNRILMAKQQNMMFKQALARSYFSPAAQPQASFSDATASPRSGENVNYVGGYSQQPVTGPSQQLPPQQAPYQPQYQQPSHQPQPTYAHPPPQQPSVYSQAPGNAQRGDYYRGNGPFHDPIAPGNAQMPPQYAQQQPAPTAMVAPQQPAFRQPSAAPAQPSTLQAAPMPSSAGAPPVAASLQSPGMTPSSSTASLQRQPSVASVASFRPDNEPTPVAPAAAAPSRRQLRALVSDIAQQVSSVQQTMQQDRQQHLSLAEQLREQKKLEKTRLLASLQQQKQQQQQQSQQNNIADEAADATLPILPRWRHLLLGHKLPLPPASLMKMKRLWRAVAFALVCVVVVPQRRALHRKQQRRDKAAKDCARSLRIFVEGCEEWLGKRVALPLQSIVDDASLDFDLRNLPSHLRKTTLSGPQQQQLEKHLVPLKVRFKALIQALTSSTATGTATADGTAATAPALPNAKATAFLVGLIDDDNYFPDDFLYACEDAVVSKSSLGGTRGIVAPAETEDDAARFSKALETQLLTGGPSSLSEALLVAERRLVVPVQIEIARKRPAESPAASDAVGASTVAGAPQTSPVAVLRRFVHTGAARMLLLDTLLVRVLVTRIVLTPWHAQVSKPPANRHTRRVTANLRTLASLCYALARRLNPALPTREDVLAKVQVQAATAAAAASSPSTRAAPTADGSDAATAATAAADSATAAGASKGSTAATAGGKGMFGALLKLTGFADTTPGHEDFQAGSVEYALLAPRFSPYESLEETMKLLLPRAQVFPSTAVHDVLDGWLEELAPVVRQWLDAVTAHVLQAHLLKHHERLYLVPTTVDASTDEAAMTIASTPAVAPAALTASSSRLASVASVGGGIGGGGGGGGGGISAAPSAASLRAPSVAS